MRRCFEKNQAVKDFDIKQKNQFKKNRGSSRVEGSGLQLVVIPYFFDPPEIPIYVRSFKLMFVSGNKPLNSDELREN